MKDCLTEHIKMPVHIRGGRIRDDLKGGVLYLANSGDVDYASWPFHINGENSSMAGDNIWKWKNPGDISPYSVDLTPSLKYEGEIGPNFHVYINEDGIEHLSDCKCGCKINA